MGLSAVSDQLSGESLTIVSLADGGAEGKVRDLFHTTQQLPSFHVLLVFVSKLVRR
jgi:hypothetical protein